MRALSSIRGALVLFALTSSASAAGVPFWSELSQAGLNHGDWDQQKVKTLYNVSQPNLGITDSYLEIPLQSGKVRINGSQLYAILKKAWNLNEQGLASVNYTSTVKWFMSPQSAGCGGFSCINILGSSISVTEYEAYQNGSSITARVRAYGDGYLGTYWNNGAFAEDCSANSPLTTWYFTGAISNYVDARSAAESGVANVFRLWSQEQTYKCNSFAKFVNDKFSDDIASALGAMATGGVKVSSTYVTLVDYEDPTSTCTTQTGCDSTSSGGSTTPGGSTTNNPACTRTDGSTSGNPYDCAPSEEGCVVVQLICMFKKAFIPRDGFLQNIYSAPSLTQMADLPIIAVDYWEFEFKGEKVKLDFSIFQIPDAVKIFVSAIIYWRYFYWLMEFFGLPLPFGNPRSSHTGNIDISRDMYESFRTAAVGPRPRRSPHSRRRR